jgi:hypothetical protein
MSQNHEKVKACLYDVLSQDSHRYFIGIVEHKEMGKYLAPIPPVRVKATGMLVEPARQVELQKELKQNVLKEVIRQIENGAIDGAQTGGGWFDSPIDAVEACLYQPVMSCSPADLD